MPETGAPLRGLACVGLAVLGRAAGAGGAACRRPPTRAWINWNPFTETWRNLKLAHGNVVVFRSLLGISWMWFFGAVFLASFRPSRATCCMATSRWRRCCWWCFRWASASAALLCEMLSRRHVEIGLVPLGAIGMSVFSIDLYFASRGLPPADGC
jgi:hypothetical protein